ncbi:MAG: hypothetical protein Q7N87_00770 [Candidatus Uhrbacteria bacterium]|nr:hypothetical protein [Candidatus Uhrbacteria bacterium]
MKKSKLKSDKYRKVRGGYSRLLQVSCASCDAPLLSYQKDGPGALKRLYLDRISESKDETTVGAGFKPTLVCGGCKMILGTYYLYPKEHRPAFRLYQGAVTKKIMKNK